MQPRFHVSYNSATEICVGDPRKTKTSFKVRFPLSSRQNTEKEKTGALWSMIVAISHTLSPELGQSGFPSNTVFNPLPEWIGVYGGGILVN